MNSSTVTHIRLFLCPVCLPLQIAKEINKSPSVVLLRWPLQQGLVVIPCSTSQEHLRENLEALDVELSEDQMKRLCAIRDSVTHRFCWDPHTIA